MSEPRPPANSDNDASSEGAPELIIFDCDGVLVDSECIGSRVVSECLKDAGIDIPPPEIAHKYAGLRVDKMIADIESSLNRKLPANFSTTLHKRLFEAFKLELRSPEGLIETLRAIQQRVCVASSSSAERVRFSLDLVGLGGFFEPNIFSATQVAHGKPAPDLFLFAAQSMSVAPSRCLVVEDSVPGIQAAVSARMRAFGFIGGSHLRGDDDAARKLVDAGALQIFDSMRKLLGLIS